MWPNPQGTADLIIFTEEILNGKLFLCSVSMYEHDFICINTISSQFHMLIRDFPVFFSSLKIDGYDLVRADHPNNTKRGGVCVYYK